jgi:Cu-processing system ATP-binding protein
MKVKQVFEMIRNIRNPLNMKRDDDLYRALKIDQIEEKTMQSLSGGTRQKVSAALAFMFNPEVLILDEPTAGLDPVSSEILKEKIIKEKNAGKLILITSHILSDLDDLTTDIMYLQEGKVQFFDSLSNIQDYTGEERLGKAIARIMLEGFDKGQPTDKARTSTFKW